ncbi:DUF6626 family protein [Azospirillum doebereinerae]|uniref:DUF6626 family protein n=1 Tax=Azospirillum doebereinerae TaxID=92933 RepID=UPI001EE58677|nr:DUF6626 family protein [Azospirillum doebereinerae]MCG5240941.1 hypothetical protein [Azospirillum doebereinerae]
METITEAFLLLRANGAVSGGRDFSQAWLGRSASYLSSMMARPASRRPSTGVLMTLYVRLREYIEEAGMTEDVRPTWEEMAERIWGAAMDRINRNGYLT